MGLIALGFIGVGVVMVFHGLVGPGITLALVGFAFLKLHD